MRPNIGLRVESMMTNGSGVTVFWDWNGTLCDDLSVSLDAVNALLSSKGRPPISLEQYYSYLETPISGFYAHLFDLNQVTMEEISLHYRTYYDAHLSDDCLMPGIRDVLQSLSDFGARQVILSSAHQDGIRSRAEKAGILRYFSDIIAADDWYAFSKIDRAKAFLSGQSLLPERCWFVGDAAHDAEVAVACGCLDRCLLLPLGHQSREDLEKTGGKVISDVLAIARCIMESKGT